MKTDLTEQFIADLKWSIEETDRKGKLEHKPSKTYKPSSLYCIRSMYYQMIGAELEPEQSKYTLINICNSGSDIHIRLQQAIEAMRNNGIDCEYVDVGNYIEAHPELIDIEVTGKSGMETKLHNKRLNMNFMCDGLIKYKGVYHLLEIKTETSTKWFKRYDVDDGHKDQAAAYSISLGLPDVVFIYINRDFLDMKSFIYIVDEEKKQEVEDKIKFCNTCLEESTVPPKPDIDSKKCNYCAYKSRCTRDS